MGFLEAVDICARHALQYALIHRILDRQEHWYAARAYIIASLDRELALVGIRPIRWCLLAVSKSSGQWEPWIGKTKPSVCECWYSTALQYGS